MNERACPRLWEVEAARDQRLSGEALASHERHRSNCDPCKHEQRAFEALAEAIRADAPVDEVALRRLRSSVLREAHGGSVPAPIWQRRHSLALALVLAAVAVATIVLAPRERSPIARARTLVVVTPSGSVSWAESSTPKRHEVVLRDGTLDLSVQRARGDSGVVVIVPDGEIEDVGTRFQVAVHDGVTAAISVSEGAVLFHRKAADEVHVGAGERWVRSDSSPAGVGTRSAVPSEPAASTYRPRVGPAPTAVGAEVGDASTSAAAEDAAYLHVVALLREGREAEARLAAREYLGRFPTGFRRLEMERVAK